MVEGVLVREPYLDVGELLFSLLMMFASQFLTRGEIAIDFNEGVLAKLV